MQSIKLCTKVFGFIFILVGFNSSVLAQLIRVQTNTSFTCSSNAECKRKCEALGKDHTWKPNPGGSTFGTCTKRGSSIIRDNNQSSFEGTEGVFIDNENPLGSSIKTTRIQEMLKNKQWTEDKVFTPNVPLTILECETLGGTVQYHPGCGTTLLKCSNRGYAACITKTKLTKK